MALIDGWRAPPPDPARAGWLGAQVYAHRGLHDGAAEENSPAAFAAAIAADLGIECDVRCTRDGRAVVFHDATLDRLAGRHGRIDGLSVGEVTGTRLAKGGETIPTLRDLLDLVAGRVPLLIEVKTERGRSVHRLCRAVRRDLEGYTGQAAVMSFDPRVGRWFALRAPHILRGLVVSEQNGRTFSGLVRRHLALWHARAQFLAYDVRDLPSGFAAAQKKRGLPLLCWTVSTPVLANIARENGAAPIAEGAGLAKLPAAS
ncbi:glycerophosphodiester phosphodiesterase family protein [Altererythrobacter lauratis]|uniref:Glycerophosphodiester phosphodiesterase family protein n=1 Tax=Alteraurantiacibacter lauratis TaxID=2054627 RepID=A0ABV7EFQ3_9SPHN